MATPGSQIGDNFSRIHPRLYENSLFFEKNAASRAEIWAKAEIVQGP